MPYFGVMSYEAGKPEGTEHKTVQARHEKEAAEIVCGEPLMEGAKLGDLRAMAWPISSPGAKKAFRVQPRIVPD